MFAENGQNKQINKDGPLILIHVSRAERHTKISFKRQLRTEVPSINESLFDAQILNFGAISFYLHILISSTVLDNEDTIDY